MAAVIGRYVLSSFHKLTAGSCLGSASNSCTVHSSASGRRMVIAT
ncbi:Uncharacterised protein [Mycobacteroides abscessus subsp. abscessus]|nr:Uncharacterised protein [Mycobacteroides abscessus subsp. abscessus]